MSRLTWGLGSRPHEEGVSNGVLYSGDTAIAWNGLVSVEEKAVGSQDADHYFDGRRLVVTQEIGDFEAAIEAFTYPDEFEEYSGYEKLNIYKRFGLSYRTQSSTGDKIHVVYNALVRPPDRKWTTVMRTPTPSTFKWDILAASVPIPGARPASHLVIDTEYAPWITEQIEDVLYGTSTVAPRLPTPAELITLFENATRLRISYNPDGSWTAEGPPDMVIINPDGSFTLRSPTLHYLDAGTFRVRSY
jgi:hypothetical protein